MTNEEQKDRFLKWIGEHYNEQRSKLIAYCVNKKINFDEDVFHDSIIKIVTKIEKEKLNDDSDKGLDAYLFMTFKTNIQREKLYARNLKKNDNVTDLNTLHEEYINTLLTEREKLIQDLFRDYCIIYILKKVEDNFPAVDYRLFKIKLFDRLTYKQLSEATKERGIRQKIVNVKKFIETTITKEEMIKQFNKDYGDLVF